MDFFLALFYGFIQGVAEFLPISSSGHLALMPFFGEFPDPGVFFDLSLHLGTSVAVIAYFRKEILDIIRGLINIVVKRQMSREGYFALNLIVASIGTFVLVVIEKKFAFSHGRNSWLIAINLIVFGVLLYLADYFCKKDRGAELFEKSSLKIALLIGISQALAIFPGVSRSGITITTSRFLGISKEYASRFSFLLSLPVILGGFILELPDAIASGAVLEIHAIVIGILSSFFFGIITIHFFLKLIKRINLVYFMYYRIVLGGMIIYFLVR